MKRLLTLLLCALLLLTGASFAETAPAPIDAQSVSERALPLLALIAGCESFYSFDGVPAPELAGEAVCAYLAAHADVPAPAADEILRKLFACEWDALPVSPDAPALLPALVTLEDAYEGASGTVIACVKTELDYGDGFEFAWYAEFTLAPDAAAEYGARVQRALIPD